MANEVIWFDSTEAGAPTLNNAAGSMISVLDACLVNGFNSKSITSLVVAGAVATATCSAHGFPPTVGKLVLISGATPAGLNGFKTILSATTNTFTFAATGISDQTASGTITVKRAPLGWSKAFSGTNKAAYKSVDAASTGMYLRVDDTATGVATTTDARAVGYESMSDVDTGVNPFPTVAQLSGGHWWNKGDNTVTAKAWCLVGDGRLFYLFTNSTADAATVPGSPCIFGDFTSYRASDAFACMISGYGSAVTGSFPNAPGFCYLNPPTSAPPVGSVFCPRLSNGAGTAVAIGIAGVSSVNGARVPGYTSNPSYPSYVDNGMIIQKPIWVSETNVNSSHPFRGELPGLGIPLANQPLNLYGIITGATGFAGSLLTLMPRGYDTNVGSVAGRIMLDITGPWR